MKTTLVVPLLAVISITAWMAARSGESVRGPTARTPVLVELFTSESCSSCPPADRFLEKLDQQPVPGAELIVLSEHVDYWNHIGWKDPYSTASFSARQSAYAHRFGLDEVYTPQMVVDGAREFVGSDSNEAGKAFQEALNARKISVHLSSGPPDSSGRLRVHLETGLLETSFGARLADVYLTVALNRAESQVSAGENAGHKLSHVAVAGDLQKVGVLNQGQTLARDVQLKTNPGSDLHNLRLIAFIQEPKQGRVLGAAMLPVGTE